MLSAVASYSHTPPEDMHQLTWAGWQEHEVNALKQALDLYGQDWEKVAMFVGTKAPQQVFAYAQQYMLENNIAVGKLRPMRGRNDDVTKLSQKRRDLQTSSRPPTKLTRTSSIDASSSSGGSVLPQQDLRPPCSSPSTTYTGGAKLRVGGGAASHQLPSCAEEDTDQQRLLLNRLAADAAASSSHMEHGFGFATEPLHLPGSHNNNDNHGGLTALLSASAAHLPHFTDAHLIDDCLADLSPTLLNLNEPPPSSIPRTFANLSNSIRWHPDSLSSQSFDCGLDPMAAAMGGGSGGYCRVQDTAAGAMRLRAPALRSAHGFDMVVDGGRADMLGGWAQPMTVPALRK